MLQLCGFKPSSAELYGAAQFIRPAAGDLASDVAGLGGTNLHGVDLQVILKHNSHIINKLRFAINS